MAIRSAGDVVGSMTPRYNGAMPTRHLPKLWLMTDERMGEGLWAALARLPRGSGVVFRHYATPPSERRRLFAEVVRTARKRRLVVVRGGAHRMRFEAGSHNRARRDPGLKTFAVHGMRDAVAARRMRADLVFVSPVFDTRSHPGARPLGRMKAAALARIAGVPAIALGGMDLRRFERLHGFWGWAGIDAWATPGVAPPRFIRTNG